MAATDHQPPPAPEDDLVLAPRLRDLRQAAGLTLESAASRAGLSAAHLSRLESGLRQPSLPVLLGLARMYGTTVSDLLGETAGEPDPIVRGADAAAVPAGGWTYWRAGGNGRAMQALRLHIPAGAQRALVRVHPGEEWLYVTAGTLDLTLGERTHTLAPGDSAHFDSLVPHRLAAAGGTGADVLFVHTLMQSETSALCVGAPSSRTTAALPAAHRTATPRGDRS
ncbi:helix-turn-helix domain-containing protein [Actinacidiphila bryophytorum]|uniref:Transcriptional regulator, XRE family with cupin sensor n=1 Tax=Actinacidiphila bryophytorum TaxID=1436133 RepID=A0A9W4H2J5_9ACTN|nr:XRE family transcriptional regulator [Actinacidiphila bryophytorum]MBM9440307.1 helix-turn-helix domain-containing protein [Actinacidiphila bryophytorum]MBN6545069.1 helix-turn-helix domain-containing protein [Actinacidiphila bryophytorum]CAG7645656.1 Transcriptional regulator, XRE family with cupin sensor [Actinacidiphila bryophytorum]